RDRRALAELAVSVIAPAVRAGAGLHAPAHVVPPGPHGGEVEPTGYRDGTALGNGRPVAKLTVQVLAPAVCRTADRHAAAEVAARVHHGEAQPAGDACRHRALGRRAVPELAPDVIAPAIRGAMRGRAARVDVAGAYPRKAQPAHGGEAEPAGDGHRGRPRDAGAVPQLSEEVVPPAIRRAARGHATRVPHTGADHREPQPPRDGRRARPVPGRGRGPLPELTGEV